jgi:hypothetical protein
MVGARGCGLGANKIQFTMVQIQFANKFLLLH